MTNRLNTSQSIDSDVEHVRDSGVADSAGLSRRGVLGLGAGLAAWAMLGGRVRAEPAAPAIATTLALRKTRVARLAHLTDTHIQPELGANEGVQACLKHVATASPDLIVTGGDLIMDGFAADFDRTKLQFDLFTKAFKDHAPCRVEHCLGNHDIWGWNKSKSKTKGNESQWGKKWAVETLGLPREYHAFDVDASGGASGGASGWRVIVLDSVRPDGKGYIAHLDDPQQDWLKSELAKSARQHVLVVSHIPIIAACTLRGSWDGKATRRTLSGGLMHLDGGTLHKTFAAAGNVKLCLSGHIHQIDRVEMEGVTYICDGAVSGSWWKGANGSTREGYGVIDLFSDGSFEHAYVPFGWTART